MQIPFFIAHRGGDLAPENTMPSFEAAAAMGAKMIEFDVQLSADGHLVVIHDDTVNRTTNRRGQVSKHSLADLRLMDAGSWFSPAFVYTQIPTLDEVLEFAASRKLLINLEIKSTGDSTQNQKLTEAIAEKLSDYEALQTQILISSFHSECLYTLRKRHPYIPMGYLVVIHDWKNEFLRTKHKIQKEVDELNCQSIHINHASDRSGQTILTEHHIEQLKNLSQAEYLMSYTVNDVCRAQQLKDWGVDALFSDRLEMIESFA